MSLDNVLISQTIYTNAKEGKEASAADLASLGPNPIQKILLEGHAQLSTEERRKKVEQKFTEVSGFLHMNYTGLDRKPIPLQQIINAMNSIKGLQIDPFQEASVQAQEIMKKLEKGSILHFQSAGLEYQLSVKYAKLSQVQTLIKKFQAKITEETYGDVDVTFKIEIIPGKIDELLAGLESTCGGDYDFKTGQDGNNVQEVETVKGGKKKAKK